MVRLTFIACTAAGVGAAVATAVAMFIVGAGDAVKLVITPPDTNGLLDVFLVAR